ncbi:MAG: DUF4956 domain-containing protein [Planctomycetes bacterium]|nr:DUF4956 domain-containing protein [Planctomycetota bacterium]
MPIPQDPSPAPWHPLADAFAAPNLATILTLAVYLVLGGLLALYVRFLYRLTSRNPTGDSIARVFPLLTLVTIAVMSVVKTSLALSLGLVGALSIVRFRAAIKDPEELVYLFLCIGIGLSLGAEQPWLAIVLIGVATLFVLFLDKLRSQRRDDAFLTVIGSAEKYFGSGPENALEVVLATGVDLVVQRCEVDGDEGQLRVHLLRVRNGDAQRLVATLRGQLPGCQISYVDAGALS